MLDRQQVYLITSSAETGTLESLPAPISIGGGARAEQISLILTHANLMFS